jgi:hypothetical protein
MSIVNDCMIVNLQIGIWSGHRLDKEASRAVTEQNNAAADTARVNKHIVPKDALKDITSTSNAVRAHFYEKTLPWKDNGDRVLTRMMFTTFMQEHAALREAFDAAVAKFVDVTYPTVKEQAEFRMGELFKADDFPPAYDLRRRFYVNLDIDAVTEAKDFRVAMEATQLDSIRSGMESALQERMGRAMQDVWARLADTLGHFAKKMGSDEVFRDSTVRNLEDIIDMLPALNLLNDPELERIRLDLKATVSGHDPKVLRGKPVTRSVVAAEAQRIIDDMAGFMNAFKVAA